MDRDLLWEYWKEILGAILKQYGVLIVATIVIVAGGYYALRYAIGPHTGGGMSENSDIVVTVPNSYSGLVLISVDAQKGAQVPDTGPTKLQAADGLVPVATFDRFVIAPKSKSRGVATAAPVAFVDEGGKAIQEGAFGNLTRAVWPVHFDAAQSYEMFYVGDSKGHDKAQTRQGYAEELARLTKKH